MALHTEIQSVVILPFTDLYEAGLTIGYRSLKAAMQIQLNH